MSYHYGNSAENYMAHRRARAWAAGNRGLHGYAQFLGSGGMGGYGDDSGVDVSAVVGAGAASMDASMGDTATRAILVGVTTGVLTFLLNRWLGKVLG